MSRTDVVALADTVGKAIEKVLTTVFPAKVEEDPLVRRLRVRAGLVTLPEPVLLNNPRWLKEPCLWPLFAAHHKVVKGHLRSDFGSAGPLALSFEQEIQKAYPRVDVNVILQLAELFGQMILIYLNHPSVSGVEDLMITIDPIINRGNEVFAKLDSDLVRDTLGANAADTFFQHRVSLNPLLFAGSAEDALKRATNKRDTSDPRGKPRERKSRRIETGPIKCRHCLETLPKGGNYAMHNKICKMKKTK